MTVSSLWLCRWYGPPSEEVAYAQLIEEIALEDYIYTFVERLGTKQWRIHRDLLNGASRSFRFAAEAGVELDCCVLLHQAGARGRIVTRRSGGIGRRR